MELAVFTFNPFQENTYVLSDDSGECVIIDPGMSNAPEQQQMLDYIDGRKLTPVGLVNTHCHIDHVLGNRFIADKYKLRLTSHRGESVVLQMQGQISQMYQIPYEESPEIELFLDEGDLLKFGATELSVLYTPGHSPASISFYHDPSKTLIAGDVLFQGSIGRTDLPGGDFNTLISSIKEKFFVLDDEVKVYPGHGPDTTIGIEKVSNPFLQ